MNEISSSKEPKVVIFPKRSQSAISLNHNSNEDLQFPSLKNILSKDEFSSLQDLSKHHELDPRHQRLLESFRESNKFFEETSLSVCQPNQKFIDQLKAIPDLYQNLSKAEMLECDLEIYKKFEKFTNPYVLEECDNQS